MYYPLLRQSLRTFLTRIYLLLSNLAKKLNVMYIIVYDARISKFYLFSPEMNSHDRIILWNYFFFFRWLCHFSVTIQKTMTSLCILIFYLPKIQDIFSLIYPWHSCQWKNYTYPLVLAYFVSQSNVTVTILPKKWISIYF